MLEAGSTIRLRLVRAGSAGDSNLEYLRFAVAGNERKKRVLIGFKASSELDVVILNNFLALNPGDEIEVTHGENGRIVSVELIEPIRNPQGESDPQTE